MEPGDDTRIEAVLATTMYVGSVDPILVLDARGTVLDANGAADAAFGREMVGSHFGIPTTPGTPIEIELLTPEGPRVAELRLGEVVVEDDRLFVINLRDVTERKRVEASLRDFVSTASHEFRTPLFAIAGFGETLALQWDQLEDEDRRRYVGIMHRQAERLSRLTDHLLTVARMDADRLEVVPTPTTLNVTIGHVLPLVEMDVEVIVDPRDLRVLVDPDHIEEVLLNLLTNAGKYGAAPFQVVARRLEDGRAELSVVDHGAGVPSAFRSRMFERFSRERMHARQASGTGLGLAIARGLIERNGGTLEYRETEGGGATFVVTLPAH